MQTQSTIPAPDGASSARTAEKDELPMKPIRMFQLLLALSALVLWAAVASAADLVVTGDINGTQIYDSPEGIVFEAATIQPAADVTADAAYEVTLTPGTRIAAGARFVARMKDNDGLSNRCEMQYFGDLTHDPGVDDDGDGLTNLQECQAGGFDPSDPDTDDDGVPDDCEAPFDTTAPTITRLGSNPVYLCYGDTYNDAGATASDNCIGDITGDINIDNPVNTSVSGTYTVRYNVFDGAGNAAAEVTRTVYVDNQPPVITLAGDDPLVFCMGDTYDEPGANASDNCDGDITASIVIDNPVDTNQSGNYTVSYDVTDSAGNTAQTVTRTVVVLGPGQTIRIDTTYQYDDIGRLRRIKKQVQ
jgi:hypothetical protein